MIAYLATVAALALLLGAFCVLLWLLDAADEETG